MRVWDCRLAEKMQDFKKLKIWEDSMELVELIYSILKMLPDDERYNLTSQLRRAAVSVPCNIAEGCSRRSTKEFYHFLSIAIGLCFEIETQLLICIRLRYISDHTITPVQNKVIELQKRTRALQNKLKTSN